MLRIFKTGIESLAAQLQHQEQVAADNKAKVGGGGGEGEGGEETEKGQTETKTTVPPNVSDDLPPGSPMSPESTCTAFTFDQSDDKVPNITCFIMMLDITLKQVNNNM